MEFHDQLITIDGAIGGGQLLRTALSLAVVTDTPFRMDDVRRNRPSPGLKPQHLAAVELVAELCDAEVAGAELQSGTLTFRPGDARRSSLRADIGTAGSVTLLFDTVLPIAATYDGPFELTATGGTDVKWAPTIDYHRRVKVPLLGRWGLDAEIALGRTGFYPAGGGEATLRTTQASLSPIELESRGALERIDVFSKAASVLAERNVADRQADHARVLLEGAGHPVEVQRVEYPSTRSAGSSLLLRGVYERTLVGFDSLGERGRTSEEVAERAVERFAGFHATGAPVDAHMADQLMVFLALAGGRVRIPSVTAHVEANLTLVERFGSDLRLDRRADGAHVLVASAHPSLQ